MPSATLLSANGSFELVGFHQPQKKITLQIGNGQVIANIAGVVTVSNFRKQDVLMGGQGAPLVPVGDKILFPEFKSCLNLGGFANISFKQEKRMIAFDIVPCNIVLNYLANKIQKPFDDLGKTAKKGTLNKELLKKLNDLEYYKKEFPKSLGIEWVKKEIAPFLANDTDSIKNQLRTFVEHIADQISTNLKEKTLATGGGVKNKFLLERICEKAKKNIHIPTTQI